LQVVDDAVIILVVHSPASCVLVREYRRAGFHIRLDDWLYGGVAPVIDGGGPYGLATLQYLKYYCLATIASVFLCVRLAILVRVAGLARAALYTFVTHSGSRSDRGY